MSRAILKGNASGTGSVTLESPATNSDRTIALPDATCNMAYEDSSGNLQVNSGYGSKATAYGCRAWVNFNGTGTVAIRASGNVSSITDNGTGNYTINFTTALPDANYVTGYSDIGWGLGYQEAFSTTSFKNITYSSNFGVSDSASIWITVHR